VFSNQNFNVYRLFIGVIIISIFDRVNVYLPARSLGLLCHLGETPLNDIFIHSSMALQPFVVPWPLLQFRNLFLYTGGRTPWTSDQLFARSLPIQTQNQRIHRHPCLEWDSDPRSQCPSERRKFMP
jgi:hypothetical protein